MSARPLPGTMIDLATDGVRNLRTRGEVVTAVRRVMFSACRAGWTWPEVHHLLTDTTRRRLAKQIATGRGDRPISKGTLNELLRRQWDDVTAAAAAAPAWNRDDALRFLDTVQDSLDASDVADLDRQVLQVVLDLARDYGTTRPAVPVRTVEERLGISRRRAFETLKRLCAEGDWLDLAKRGDRTRANLYRVAPALRPSSQHNAAKTTGEPMTVSSLTIQLDDDDQAAVLELLAQRQRDKSRPRDTNGDVVMLDTARRSARAHGT